MSYKEGGFEEKYIITKRNGNPIDEDAKYFVLRLDKDPHALKALAVYAFSVKEDNEEFALDLFKIIGENQLKLLGNLWTE